MPPNEPPTAINPKSRLPCSVVNRSVMNPQKTAVAKRLKTLTQTKKHPSTHGCFPGGMYCISTKKIIRLRMKTLYESDKHLRRDMRDAGAEESASEEHMHENNGEHPHESFEHLRADVIA